MEIFNAVVTLIGHLAWPIVAVIVMVKFSPAINSVIYNISQHLSSTRNIRAKLGGFEIESNEVILQKDELEKIVKEDNPEKRLELYKRKFNAESVIKELSKDDLKWLRKFSNEYNIPRAFLVWPWGEEARQEVEAYNKLEKLGLVKTYNAPLGGGEWIGMITGLGDSVLSLLESKMPNKANPADSRISHG